MGLETLAMIAFSAVKTISSASAANKQTKALSRQQDEINRVAQYNAEQQALALQKQGGLEAKNKALEVARRTGAAKTSFLSSGLAWEGTPESAIGGILDAGAEDVAAIGDLYSTRAKNQAMNITSEANLQNMQIQGQKNNIVSEHRNQMMSDWGSLGMPAIQGAGSQHGLWGGYDPSTGITWNSGR